MSNQSPPILTAVARHAALIGVLVTAAALRLPGLGDWWLNPDEGIYYSILTRADFSDFAREVAENAHPPLYYLLLRGIRILTWDFVWLRGFSVVCGVAAVAGAWAVSKRLSGGGARGTVAALFAGLLVAFSPGAVEMSRVMRPYMLLLALLSWAFYFLLKELDSSPAGPADPESGQAGETTGLGTVACSLLLCLAILTHYSSLFALGVFGALLLHDGLVHGFERLVWRRLAGALAVPVALLGVLWVTHLRIVSGSGLATEALEGWLRGYMIDGPDGVWRSLLGYQRLAAPIWFRGPAAVALVLALAYAALRREWRPLIAGASAVAIAAGAAALHVYPFGATRHSIWLITFTAPLVGWLCAALLDTKPGVRVLPGVLFLGLMTGMGGPLGTLLGVRNTPWAPDDLILRRSGLATVMPLLSTDAPPELVVVPEQTFYLLLPLWAQEREAATFSADGSAFHFRWGDRRVLVSRYWDFSARPGAASGEALIADGRFAADIGRFLESSDRAFPELGISGRAEGVIVVGGWVTGFVDELKNLHEVRPLIRSGREVPGLQAFVVDLDALASAVERP